MDWLTLTHAASTLAMVGLIWFVQVVHYPLLTAVGSESFADYEAGHVRRTSLVVGPLMVTEGVTAVALAILACGAWTLAGLSLLAVIWLSTALWQVPCHRRLEGGFDAASAARLTRSNWVRTLAWTGRGGIAIALLGA